MFAPPLSTPSCTPPLAAFDAAAAPWREALEDLDEDVLAEAAAEARAFGAGPAAAVDELVRGLLG
ncbi:hypothetical protein [Streptomyces sp. NPDC051364]|uniref:hypothetical protein n=1 Tax=Streptomyces sp. NPDC051364 TaxID=3155799 RepID=UPI0034477B83